MRVTFVFNPKTLTKSNDQLFSYKHKHFVSIIMGKYDYSQQSKYNETKSYTNNKIKTTGYLIHRIVNILTLVTCSHSCSARFHMNITLTLLK
jgi:hypothetical protein